MAHRRDRALLNGSSQKRNVSRSPSSSHGDHEEPALLQQQNARVTTFSFALVNWGGGSSTEDARGYAILVREVVQSCERIVVDARPDVLRTLRYFFTFASVVAIAGIIGYCYHNRHMHLDRPKHIP